MLSLRRLIAWLAQYFPFTRAHEMRRFRQRREWLENLSRFDRDL